jgi:TPR repeat protein
MTRSPRRRDKPVVAGYFADFSLPGDLRMARREVGWIGPVACCAAAAWGPSPSTAATTQPTTDPAAIATTAPATAPSAVAADLAEVQRLKRLGLPDRPYLAAVFAARAPAWRAAEAAGDADAPLLLGRCLAQGVGGSADVAAAVAQYQLAADRGSNTGRVFLGLARVFGVGIGRDAEVGMDSLRKAAEAGDAEAMYFLGVIYDPASAVMTTAGTSMSDPVEALKWYRAAADTGYPLGVCGLGQVYAAGRLVAADPARASALLQQSADAGCVTAMIALADAADRGAGGLPPDQAAAVDGYRRAADAGSPTGMLRMVLVYLLDRYHRRDVTAAQGWIHRAADTGDPVSLVLVGDLVARGSPPALPPDPTGAVAYYQQAADGGSPTGLRRLAGAYMSGRGVARDPERGRQLLRRGADAGDAESMTSLAATYAATGAANGFKPDPAVEVSWLRRAVALNNLDAINNLALCYLHGEGVPVDQKEALRLFRKAAAGGLASAMTSVGLRYERGEGVKADPAEAARWYSLGLRNNDPLAAIHLGLFYRHGIVMHVDGAQAERLFLAAVARFRAEGRTREAGQTEFELCALYLDPKAGVANGAKAIDFAKRAATDGHPNGWGQLGFAALTGSVLAKDPVAARGYLQHGADGGDAYSMLVMGQCQQSGAGGPVDEAAAADSYRRAIAAGSVDGMDALALLLWKGRQLPHELATAAALFRRASDKGSASGAGHLAVMLANGDGVPRDAVAAADLAQRAKAGGHPEFVDLVARAQAHQVAPPTNDARPQTDSTRPSADPANGPGQARPNDADTARPTAPSTAP